MPVPLTPEYIATLVTAGDIARVNGHSRTAVYKAILRLKIKPVLKHPIFLYDPAQIAKLKDSMRQTGGVSQP